MPSYPRALCQHACGHYARRGGGNSTKGVGSQKSRKDLMQMVSEEFGEALLPYTTSRYYGKSEMEEGCVLDPLAYFTDPVLIDYAGMML